MIKAVLFDLDGTLLNRDESLKPFIELQYGRFEKRLNGISKAAFTSRFIDLDMRGYVWKDKVYQQLVTEFNLVDITWEELLLDYVTEFKNSCIPFPNLKTVLEKLKGQKLCLGIISNGYGQFQLDNIKALGIEHYFDVILISEWEGIKKPDSKIFMRAVEKLNVAPHECVFVGDHPENDVNGARHVGMKGVWKKDLQGQNVEADAIVNDLAELPQVIETLM